MNKPITFGAALLLACTAHAATMSQLFGFRSVTDSTYGAVCGTTSDDSAAFQAALDAASSAGGGTVKVPKCSGSNYYYFLTGLSIPSNVTLQCERGAVLKQRSDDPPAYPVSGGTGLIGFYGVTNAGIDGCTLDSTGVTTASEQANPVEIRDSNPSTAATNTRSSYLTIQNLTIRAQSHSAGPYLIWVREADNVRVLNNNLDGGQSTYTATTDQQGIETIAVTKVEIAGNQIKNIGRYGILIGAYSDVDQAGYYTEDVRVRDNILAVVGGSSNGAGIGIEAADAGTNVAYLANVVISGNVIRDPWQYGLRAGISGTVDAGNDMFRNILIDGNAVAMTDVTQTPTGMHVQFGSANPDIIGFTVSNNTFQGGKGGSNEGTCLHLQFAKSISFTGNRCAGGDVSASSVYTVMITPSEATSNLLFTGNYFGPSNGSSWYVGGGDDYVVSGNTFEGWNATTDAQPAIDVQATANRWVVTGNKFTKDPNNASNEGYLMNGTTSLVVGWTWKGNSRSWTPSFNRQANGIWDGTCGTTPGNAPQFGCVTINTGAATATVTNGLVRSGSRVYLNQTSGDPVAAKAAPGSGSFVVTLASNCATANCTFFYDIEQ